jgi:elongation factor 1-gamma
MSHTLFVEPGNFRAFKILIAAEYNGVSINIPEFTANKSNTTPEFLKISPMGKVPAMQTPQGGLCESNAIARYVARMRADTGLMGATFFESAEVDQWIDFCSHNIELPACIWFYPTLGYMEANTNAIEKAKGDLAAALTVLDAHLASRTFLVGEAMTLADITIASTLVYPFKFVCDPKYRAAYGNVVRWFETCVNQPEYEAVVGKVVLATSEAGANSGKAIAAPAKKGKGEKPAWDGVKKEKAPKEKKEKAPKPPAPPKEKKVVEEEEPEEAPKEKKEEHLFKKMDSSEETKSPFVMDAWKRDYSNAADYTVAINNFFNTADWKGWSLFRGDYNYNEELKVLFMSSNLIGGFIQRTDEIRKWLFGTMSIRGEEGKDMKISCYFFIRGQDIQPLIDCNDDAACYTWTKVCGGDKVASEEDKALVTKYWSMDVDDEVEGTKCLDSRVYK